MVFFFDLLFVAASVNIIRFIKIKIKTTEIMNSEMYEFIYLYNVFLYLPIWL